MVQVGELAKRVGKAPQPFVNHFAEGKQSVGHGWPPLSQSNLKQRSDDASSILKEEKVKKKNKT